MGRGESDVCPGVLLPQHFKYTEGVTFIRRLYPKMEK